MRGLCTGVGRVKVKGDSPMDQQEWTACHTSRPNRARVGMVLQEPFK